MRLAVVVVAAGRGTRAGGPTSSNGPKQYQRLDHGAGQAGLGQAGLGQAGLGRTEPGRAWGPETTVLARTLAVFARHPRIETIQVVIHADDRDLYAKATAEFATAPGDRLRPAVIGAATRQGSVLAGLEALAVPTSDPATTVPPGSGPVESNPTHVLIHDAARPFVDAAVIDRVADALAVHAGAIAGLPVSDTLKRQSPDGLIAATIDRTGLWRAQTPQGFRFADIIAAHRRAAVEGRAEFTDDAALAEWAEIPVALVLGSAANVKLTTAEDLILVQGMGARGARVDQAARLYDIRMATGFDVHRFKAGDHVWLCGVRIPHDAALEGHSDADVGLHALTDALLGAIADGDIGQHFPPSDPQWRGAASHLFLADAGRRIAARGGQIVHCDVTLLCEAPRITPHRQVMRARIAEILSLALDSVSVKATTTEGLGFTGRREGIAAQAAATVRLPSR